MTTIGSQEKLFNRKNKLTNPEEEEPLIIPSVRFKPEIQSAIPKEASIPSSNNTVLVNSLANDLICSSVPSCSGLNQQCSDISCPNSLQERKKIFTVIPVLETCQNDTNSRPMCVKTCPTGSLLVQTIPTIAYCSGVNSDEFSPSFSSAGPAINIINTSPPSIVHHVQSLPLRPLSTNIINEITQSKETDHCLCSRDHNSGSYTPCKAHTPEKITFDIDNHIETTEAVRIRAKTTPDSLKSAIKTLVPPLSDQSEKKYRRLSAPLHCPVHNKENSHNNLHYLTHLSTKSELRNGILPEALISVPLLPKSANGTVTKQLPRGLTLPSLHHISLTHAKQFNSLYSNNILHVPSHVAAHTTCSLNQLTVNSAKSIDLGCTDGRNLTITGAATDPSDLIHHTKR